MSLSDHRGPCAPRGEGRGSDMRRQWAGGKAQRRRDSESRKLLSALQGKPHTTDGSPLSLSLRRRLWWTLLAVGPAPTRSPPPAAQRPPTLWARRANTLPYVVCVLTSLHLHGPWGLQKFLPPLGLSDTQGSGHAAQRLPPATPWGARHPSLTAI